MRRNVSEDGEAKLMSDFLSSYRVQPGANRISRGCGGPLEGLWRYKVGLLGFARKITGTNPSSLSPQLKSPTSIEKSDIYRGFINTGSDSFDRLSSG